MAKRIWTGFVVVFLATQILETLLNFYVFDPIYSQWSHIWRPIAEVKLWMLPFTGLFFSFFFTYIFSKGFENKGLAEGVRFGTAVAMMVALPHAYGAYALMQIPYSVALLWFLFGTAEYIMAGVLLALVFRKEPDQPAST